MDAADVPDSDVLLAADAADDVLAEAAEDAEAEVACADCAASNDADDALSCAALADDEPPCDVAVQPAIRHRASTNNAATRNPSFFLDGAVIVNLTRVIERGTADNSPPSHSV